MIKIKTYSQYTLKALWLITKIKAYSLYILKVLWLIIKIIAVFIWNIIQPIGLSIMMILPYFYIKNSYIAQTYPIIDFIIGFMYLIVLLFVVVIVYSSSMITNEIKKLGQNK